MPIVKHKASLEMANGPRQREICVKWPTLYGRNYYNTHSAKQMPIWSKLEHYFEQCECKTYDNSNQTLFQHYFTII